MLYTPLRLALSPSRQIYGAPINACARDVTANLQPMCGAPNVVLFYFDLKMNVLKCNKFIFNGWEILHFLSGLNLIQSDFISSALQHTINSLMLQHTHYEKSYTFYVVECYIINLIMYLFYIVFRNAIKKKATQGIL